MKRISPEEKELIETNRRFVSHDHPFPWKQAFSKPLVWLLVTAYASIQWANYFFVAWMPNYLQEGKHLMNFFGQTGAFIMSIFFGRIVDFTHSFDTPQFLMAGILLLGALLWIGIDASKKITLEPPTPGHSPASFHPQKVTSPPLLD
jgi:hypothetical protein